MVNILKVVEVEGDCGEEVELIFQRKKEKTGEWVFSTYLKETQKLQFCPYCGGKVFPSSPVECERHGRIGKVDLHTGQLKVYGDPKNWEYSPISGRKIVRVRTIRIRC